MVKNKLLYFVENDVVSLIELIQVGRDILVKNFVVDVFEYFGVGENFKWRLFSDFKLLLVVFLSLI